MQELVNAGPFETVLVGKRDTDGYGRKLRVLVRDGGSLGDVLVYEGWRGPCRAGERSGVEPDRAI